MIGSNFDEDEDEGSGDKFCACLSALIIAQSSPVVRWLPQQKNNNEMKARVSE
jgi:hypothetical protein